MVKQRAAANAERFGRFGALEIMFAQRQENGLTLDFLEALRVNRLTDESLSLDLHPSTATSIAHGFAMISRFVPGVRDELAAIDEALQQIERGEWASGAKAQAAFARFRK